MPTGEALPGEASSGLFTDPAYRRHLAEYVCALLPSDGKCSVVDVGSGNGALAALIQELRPETTVLGVETFIRPKRQVKVSVAKIDGVQLPFRARSFDVALLINVLHHAESPRRLLEEVHRVTRGRIIIKDHVANSRFQHLQLAVLDILGNAGTGAIVRGTYLTDRDWMSLFEAMEETSLSRYEGLRFRRGVMRRLFPNELEIMFALDRESPRPASAG
jgi:SAM-dependent methyltransferase